MTTVHQIKKDVLVNPAQTNLYPIAEKAFVFNALKQ